MFNIFAGKPNFKKIFLSPDETYRFIYGDRTKTSTVLGDNEFINSWLSSKNVGQVTSVITNEALKGDIPSLRQMIWLSGIYFDDAENVARDDNELLVMRTKYLQDRVMFCQKAIEHGLKDQSYYAMASSAKLYLLRSPNSNSLDDPIIRGALAGIIKYAKLFIESGSDAQELIEDAKGTLEHYGSMATFLK